ncbi:hypothetical protein K466DRAFT_668364, partial [Polyporus arcularius HHB13444]
MEARAARASISGKKTHRPHCRAVSSRHVNRSSQLDQRGSPRPRRQPPEEAWDWDWRPRRGDAHCARPHSSLETPIRRPRGTSSPRRPRGSPALLTACTTLDTRSRVPDRPRHINKRSAYEGRSPGRRCSQRPGARHEQRCAPGLSQGARTLSRIRFLEHGRTSRSLRHAGRFSSAAVAA